MGSVVSWLRGGDLPYHNLVHCLRGDYFWIVLVVLSDLAIFTGYLVIARNWAQQEKNAPDSEASTAMRYLRLIFVFCSFTYLWTAVDVWWPGWRLLVAAKVALVAYTWRYTRKIGDLRVIYGNVRELAGLKHRIRLVEQERDLWKHRAMEKDT